MLCTFPFIQGLTHPHDVAVDSVNHIVYVGELNPQKVWKFQMDAALHSGRNQYYIFSIKVLKMPLSDY